MHRGTEQAFAALLAGRDKRVGNVSSFCGTLYSYRTALLTRRKDGVFIFNATKYSMSTSRQQSALRWYLQRGGHKYVIVQGQGFGVSGWDLCRARRSSRTRVPGVYPTVGD